MKFVRMVTATLLLMTFAPTAEARRGTIFIYGDNMSFVEDIGGVGNEGLSLCILSDDVWLLYFANIWRSNMSYVAAENKCDDSPYFPISEEEFYAAQDAGLISMNYDYVPRMTLGRFFAGFWGIFAFIGFCFGIFFLLLIPSGGAVRKDIRIVRALTGMTREGRLIVQVMAGAAKAGGSSNQYPLAQAKILEIANKMSVKPIAADAIGVAFENSRTAEGEHLKTLIKLMKPETRELAMRGVLHVLASDGRLDQQELDYVGRLAGSMGYSQEVFDKIYQDFVSEFNKA
ncbi:MAG: TerB family tellurite resistance protein [Pseudomonadota bacterium]